MPFSHHGKEYRSYKHPILEFILDKALSEAQSSGQEPPDEIPFTYEDIRVAMSTLGLNRDKQASLSNFVIDLTRKANDHEDRVPPSVWERGYDLDRMPARQVRQNYVGRLSRAELKAQEPWLVWQEISEAETIIVTNHVPEKITPYLGNDEGALLSVIDYCDVLSYAFYNTPGTVNRVQHPKKWQPGEVDGLYFSDYETPPVLFPVEAKALSTGDSINLAQIQGAYNTIIKKITVVKISPLAIQMIPGGMYIAMFEASPQNMLIISRSLKIKLEPPIDAWKKGRTHHKLGLLQSRVNRPTR